MKISYNWLKTYLKTDVEINIISEVLTNIGLEVEGVEPTGINPESLKGVVVGKVNALEKHPNADKLKVAKVNLGDGSETQIVCGAPNIEAGQTVMVATIGSTVSDKKGNKLEISPVELRGVQSSGMICSEAELGLSKNHDGIYVFDKEHKPGTPVSEIFKPEEDRMIEIGLTPNRADAMSHYGVARDLYAGLKTRKFKAKLDKYDVSAFQEQNSVNPVQIEVEDSSLVPRYAGLSFKNVKVKLSPAWLQNRLKTIGISPINNVVDITNFILHDLGQPLHAFDAKKIKGGKVVVRQLESGSKFTTLDGVERTLNGTEIMICNAEDAMCIGGVFGGLHSGITEETTEVFLESAYFDPISIRKSAKFHGLNTDASFRFERGIDPNITIVALKKAALLLIELADAEVVGKITDLYPKPIKDFDVVLRYRKLDQLIGERIHRQQVKDILDLLEIKIRSEVNEMLDVVVPAYRVDVRREVDLIEDVLRIYGFNSINTPEKMQFSLVYQEGVNKELVENTVADLLIANGLHEAMNNSMTKLKVVESYYNYSEKEAVKVLNPLSSDLEYMRTSILPGLLENVSYNINRKNTNVKLYEFGKTYGKGDGQYAENQYLGIVLSGNSSRESWLKATQKVNFYELKGVVYQILERLNLEITTEKAFDNADFLDAVALYNQDDQIAVIGKISDSTKKSADISQDVYYAQINWTVVLGLINGSRIKYKEISKFPGSRRDLALLLDKEIRYRDLYETSLGLNINLLKSINLFDVYEGDKLPEGKKSYALSFYIQDEEKTLDDKAIDQIMNKLIKTYQTKFNAELR